MRQEAINTIRKRELLAKKSGAEKKKYLIDWEKSEGHETRIIDRVNRQLPMFTCSVCGSKWSQFMKRKNGFYCRHCGHEWPKEEPPAERKARK